MTAHEPPASWSDTARTTFVDVLEEHPSAPAAVVAGLHEACQLIAAADAAQAQVDDDGLMVDGSKGQRVAHPLIAEARQSRVQAVAALRALGLAVSLDPATRAGQTLARRRHGRRATAFSVVTPLRSSRSDLEALLDA